RLVLAGAAAANGFVTRVIGTVERPPVLSVSGADSGTAKSFVPNATRDGYVATTTVPPPSIASPFGAGVATRTATGDFNGDGTFNITTGDRPSLVANFFGFSDPNFRGGAQATIGDLTGDGVQDVAIIAAINGGPRADLYDGKNVLAAKAAGTDPAKLTNDFF